VHTVAVGASAGGIEALRRLVAQLPADFPATILVVLHLPPNGTSVLPQILARSGKLPAEAASEGVYPEGGCIYVAPPDCHLLVDEDGMLRLDHGPRINGHRPAVDTLFHSVAAAYGRGAAGVVLSGVLDDGAAGLLAIKRAGGMTFAQDPNEALYEMMPRTAIEIVSPDHVAAADALGRLLAEVAAEPPPDPPAATLSLREEHLVEIDRGASDDPQPGVVTGLSCPECNGAIWLDDSTDIPQFACRIGHRFSPESFDVAQTQRVEAALWTALRTLEERAALYRRMAARHRESGSARTAQRFALRAESTVQHALVVREVIEQFEGGREEEGAA
jgi:two-component system, chemotaxis family, protein-glutamate methylesterase/glutaminase